MTQEDTLTLGCSRPPLRRKPPLVLAKELRPIDTIPGKSPATEMMDKQIMGHRQLKPSLVRPYGQIVIIKEP